MVSGMAIDSATARSLVTWVPMALLAAARPPARDGDRPGRVPACVDLGFTTALVRSLSTVSLPAMWATTSASVPERLRSAALPVVQ